MKIAKRLLSLALCAIALSASAQVFYKIEGNGLTSPSYLFGTHHLAPLSVIDTFGAKPAFDASAQVVGEIDMTGDQMQMAADMQKHMMAPADSTLSKVIKPEDFAVISEEFKKWAPMPGMELAMLEPMKPMVVTTMIAVTMASQANPGYDPTKQLDSWFQTEGKTTGKQIVGLETVDEQATLLFDKMPISYQAESLVETLKDPKEAIESTRNLTVAYNNQDLAAMLELSEKENEHPEFMKAMLDNRNANWLKKLPAIMKAGPTFIAVGALHLAGDQGLVKGLQNAGYTVTPMTSAVK